MVDVWCGGCLVWWMSGVVDVWCGGCPILHTVWWMSGVVDVWCGGCPILPMVWWMSGVVDVWCGGCPVWWMSGVVDVLFYTRCGGCLVWWMSGVVDVCVVDVVQSTRKAQRQIRSSGQSPDFKLFMSSKYCTLTMLYMKTPQHRIYGWNRINMVKYMGACAWKNSP